jgi:hypothetical protein
MFVGVRGGHRVAAFLALGMSDLIIGPGADVDRQTVGGQRRQKE